MRIPRPSARKLAGIIRNVLPDKYIYRHDKSVILNSPEQYLARKEQIQSWERVKATLMKTRAGRKYLATHYPASYQREYLLRRQKQIQPQPRKQVATARTAPVVMTEQINLHPSFGKRILEKRIPKLYRAPPFPVGKKKVYLPNIVITLKRNPRLEPYFAVFEVPLNLSKLDLRDYLWHLYGVKTRSIRSSILPGKLRRKIPLEGVPMRIGTWERTKARKKMIVQLAEPFWYPKPLTRKDYPAYDTFCYGMLTNRFAKNRYDQALKINTDSWRRTQLGITINPHPRYDVVHNWN